MEERDRGYEAERPERNLLGVTVLSFGEEGINSVWSSKFSVGDTENVPLGVRLFRTGGYLAELIVNIRGETDTFEALQFINQCNRDFSNLRELLKTSEPSLIEPLFDPVIKRDSTAPIQSAPSSPGRSGKPSRQNLPRN